jgi:SAM-dependent methyltransferase
MNRKHHLQEWNKSKWESKNHEMYTAYAENRWPWYNEALDPDIRAFISGTAQGPIDILDLGTCSGSQAIELTRLGHRVVGTEISHTALAQAKLAASRVNGPVPIFLMDDITESKLPEKHFDLVLDRGCYHSICCFQHEEYVAGVKRVLKRDGILLLKTMSSDEQRFIAYDTIDGRQVQMPYHFTEVELRERLAPHFDILMIRDSFFYSQVPDTPARARLSVACNSR